MTYWPEKAMCLRGLSFYLFRKGKLASIGELLKTHSFQTEMFSLFNLEGLQEPKRESIFSLHKSPLGQGSDPERATLHGVQSPGCGLGPSKIIRVAISGLNPFGKTKRDGVMASRDGEGQEGRGSCSEDTERSGKVRTEKLPLVLATWDRWCLWQSGFNGTVRGGRQKGSAEE